MYILTENGREIAEDYIRELEAKRKEILDAGKDTADETVLPTVDVIQEDIVFCGVNWDDPDGPCYYNGWGVTDHCDADYPILLKYGRDFVEKGYIPSDGDRVRIVEQYTNGDYHKMIPGTVVLDCALSSYWNVLSNDGHTVHLQNTKGGDRGVHINVSDETCCDTFALLARQLS